MTPILVVLWAVLAVLLSRVDDFTRPEDRLIRAGFVALSVWLLLVTLWGEWVLIGLWAGTIVVFLTVVALT